MSRCFVTKFVAGADDNLTAFIQAQLQQQEGAATEEGLDAERRSAFFARA